MKLNKKVSFVEKEQVPLHFKLNKVLDSNTLRGLYKNNLFEVVDISDTNTDDFVFVIGYGLFQIKSKKV